jgi:hypothetical protein
MNDEERQELQDKARYLATVPTNHYGTPAYVYVREPRPEAYQQLQAQLEAQMKAEANQPQAADQVPPSHAETAQPQGFTPNRGQGQSSNGGPLPPATEPTPTQKAAALLAMKGTHQ